MVYEICSENKKAWANRFIDGLSKFFLFNLM